MAIAAACAAAAMAAGPPPDAPLQGCLARHESNGPVSSRLAPGDVRFGPLILRRSADWRRPVQASRSNPQPDLWPYVLKMTVRLRAGTTATLAIAPRATDSAAILPSDTRVWVPAVRYRACPANKRARAYAGPVGPFTGFGLVIAIRKPSACVPFEVWLPNRSSPIRRVVAIGRPGC